MNFLAFQSVSLALVLGVSSYVFSRWLSIPAILFYLVCGLTAGPVGLALIVPDSMGNGLFVVLEIAVAIILFEGGLSLSLHSFKMESTAIRRILIISLPLTGLGATALSHEFLGISWQFAIFFGALIVVTGPTVVGSILKSVYLRRRLGILLNWESIWGDVIGVLLSAVALELLDINLQDSKADIAVAFFLRIVGGVIIGVISGFLLSRILKLVAHLRDSTLFGVVTFSGAIATFFVANVVFHSSGPLAVAISGFVLANTKAEYLHEIRHFKEQISSLFISTMFVLLSAYVNPVPLLHLWPTMLLVAFILGAVVRPISMYFALMRTAIPLAERTFIGFIGPRGIIAVATTVYASFIVQGHKTEMMIVLNLTFAIILLSGVMATVMSRPLARILGVRIPISQSGILLVGINPFSHAIAEFASKYVPVSFLETSQNQCNVALGLGLETICTDVLDSSVYEDAIEDGFGRLLATTRNDALNELVAAKASIHLDPKKVYRVPAQSDMEDIRMESVGIQQVAFASNFSSTLAAEMIDQGSASLEILSPKEFRDRGVPPLLEIVSKGKGVRIISPGDKIKNDVLCFVPR